MQQCQWSSSAIGEHQGFSSVSVTSDEISIVTDKGPVAEQTTLIPIYISRLAFNLLNPSLEHMDLNFCRRLEYDEIHDKFRTALFA